MEAYVLDDLISFALINATSYIKAPSAYTARRSTLTQLGKRLSNSGMNTMDDTLSNGFSLAEFQQDRLSADQRTLLQWADCELYSAFVRNAAGEEEPAVVQMDSASRYVASTSPDTLHTLLAGAKLAEGSEVVVKPLPLNELARNAYLYAVGLHILDDENGQYLDRPTLLTLGLTAVVALPESKETLYQADIFFFAPAHDAQTVPHGAVQYWYDASPEPFESQDTSLKASIYVFDDELDWANPLFPDLPEGAVALSTLSPGAKAFFERTRWPLLRGLNLEPAKPLEGEQPYHNSLAEGQALTSFNQLRAMMGRDIVPSALDITLNVADADAQEKESANTSAIWKVTISFTTPLNIKALFTPLWVPASLCQANTELPDTTGIHRASKALRERIVDHLAWIFLHRGRSFDVALFGNCLEGLLPGHVINQFEPFQPDYTDHRFPCLARFQCADEQVPVLLLGQEGGHYVCKPLKNADIQESKVPTSIPRRSELIDMASQSMPLSSIDDILVLPPALIDFPEPWYEGIRISDQNLKASFFSSMRVNVFLDEVERNDSAATSPLVKGILGACLVVMVITALVALSL